MNHQQPAQQLSSLKPWSHVLTFMAVVAWLFVQPALAGPLTNSVTVTGTTLGKPITATSSVDVTVAKPAPQLTLEKFATVNGTVVNGTMSVKPGDTITYKFTATNTGNVTLKNIKITDLDAKLDNPNAVIASLGAGLNDTTTFTATHVLSSADIAKVVYTNIANGSADVGTTAGGTVTATARASSLLNVNSDMTFAKSAQLDMGSNGRVDAGDVVTYTFTVTNTGNSDLHNVVVSDPMLNLAMLPGQERTIALLTGANEPADQFATASIPAPPKSMTADKTDSGAAAASDNNVPQLGNELHVSRQLVSMAEAHQPLAAGDKIGFVYTLINAGEGPLSAIDVQQPDGLAFGSRLELLNPGEADAASVIYTRDVTPEEIASGTVQSSATVTAKSRGQTYQCNVAGGLAVSSIRAYDSFTTASITPASQPVLAAGQVAVFTATYKLSQADIDKAAQVPNYYLHNNASVSALDLADTKLTRNSSADLALAPAPAIAVVKTGIADLGPDNVASVNDVVTYNFAITNTGNVTLHNVSVADTDLAPLTWSGSPILNLAPGQTDSTTYSATYKLVQNDVNNAKVTNKATATGTPPAGAAVTANSGTALGNTNSTIIDLTPKPAIGLVKTVKQVDDVNGNALAPNSPIMAGDTIEYVFTVKNIGNQTLNGVTVTDTVPVGVTVYAGGTAGGAPLDGLAPGVSNSTYFTAKYKLTQADVDAGTLDNTAHVVAAAPGNVTVQDDSDPLTPDPTANAPTTEVIPPQPALTVIKSQSSITYANGSGPAQANDVIHYTFAIKNVGNVTLKNVHLTDSLPGATLAGNTIAQLLPGASDTTTFTANYPITAQDILAGQVSNQATALATSPKGGSADDVSSLSDNTIANQNDPTKHAPTVTPLVAKAEVAVLKTVSGIQDTNNDGVTDAGDTITYAFSVKNTGNVPLSNVSLVEKLSGDVITGTPIPTLNAGSTDTTSFTAKYVLTAADVNLGSVTSQVNAVAQPPAGIPVTSLSDPLSFASHNPTIAYLGNTPSIGLIKTFDHIQQANPNTIAAGDIMFYKMSVVNTGNVTLYNIAVTDPIADVYAGAVLNGTLPSLAPSATDGTTFTAQHNITAADFSNGGVANQATAHGFSAVVGCDDNNPNNKCQVTDLSDPFSVLNDGKTFYPLTAKAGIGVIKTISSIDDVNGDDHIDEGDIIHYAFTIANTGNVDLVNVTLDDPNAVLSPANFTIGSLPVGGKDTATFTATHVVTAADGDALIVSNQATAKGDYVSNGDTAQVTHVSDSASFAGSNPTVQKVEKLVTTLTKSAAKGTIKRGESDIFTITATNLSIGTYEIDDLMPQYFNFVAGTVTVNGTKLASADPSTSLAGNKVAQTYTVQKADEGKITITLTLAASGALDSGKYVNNAQIRKVVGGVAGPVLATAQATVTIQDEAVFDCSDIIGRVFDDKNMNGYMDDGEPGLPGVRIATLNGLLITTDSNGLYHVPCAAIPDPKIGSNYLLKLDTRTLPLGYTVTTENPRDVRVTRGKVTKLNFGAGKDHDVRVDLSAKAFEGNSTELSSDWQQSVERLIAILQKQHSVLKLVYQRGNESEALAVARVKAVQQLISDVWTADGGTYQLAITGSVEAAK